MAMNEINDEKATEQQVEQELEDARRHLETIAEPGNFAWALLEGLNDACRARQRWREGLFEKPGPEDFVGPDGVIETQRVPIGVDMVALHAYLPHTVFERKALKAIFPRPRQNEDGFLIGRREENGFQFFLSSFPYSKGYDLKIRFNPATLSNGHNQSLEDPAFLQQSLLRLQATVDDLGVRLKVSSLSVVELHSARDIGLYHTSNNKREEIKASQELLHSPGSDIGNACGA